MAMVNIPFGKIGRQIKFLSECQVLHQQRLGIGLADRMLLGPWSESMVAELLVDDQAVFGAGR